MYIQAAGLQVAQQYINAFSMLAQKVEKKAQAQRLLKTLSNFDFYFYLTIYLFSFDVSVYY